MKKKFSVNFIIKVFLLKLLIIKKNYIMVLIQLKKGKGKMIYKEKKEQFEGEWENDKEKNGEGLIIYKDNINLYDNGIYKGKLIN